MVRVTLHSDSRYVTSPDPCCHVLAQYHIWNCVVNTYHMHLYATSYHMHRKKEKTAELVIKAVLQGFRGIDTARVSL